MTQRIAEDEIERVLALKDAPGPLRLVVEEDRYGFPQWRIMFDHGGGQASLIATVHGHRIPVSPGVCQSPGGQEYAELLAAAPIMARIIRQQRAEIEGLREEVKHLTSEKAALQANIKAASTALTSHYYVRKWKQKDPAP